MDSLPTTSASSHARRFNRWCYALALVAIVAFNTWRATRPNFTDDFAQYYNAGVIARAGAWADLYPIPHPTSPHNPGATPDSAVTPEYRRVVGQQGRPDGARVIQPPPNALWCVPLTYFPFDTAYVVWCAVMALCVWAAAMSAARVYALVAGRESRVAGVLVLILCTSPLAYRAVRCGIMTPAIAWTLGLAVTGALGATRRSALTGGVGLALGFVAKYAGAVLAPVYLLRREWAALAWAAGLTIAAVLITLLVAGPGPFETFARTIAPTLVRSHPYHSNQAIQAFLWRVGGPGTQVGTPALIFSIARIAIGLAILYLCWRQRRAIRASAATACAAMTALLTWTLLFSPVCWDHYAVYLFPLAGWFVYEASRSRGVLITLLAAAALTWFPYTGFAAPSPPVLIGCHVMYGLLLVWSVSLYRLARPSPV